MCRPARGILACGPRPGVEGADRLSQAREHAVGDPQARPGRGAVGPSVEQSPR
jgi:hypothetical protein